MVPYKRDLGMIDLIGPNEVLQSMSLYEQPWALEITFKANSKPISEELSE